MAKTITKQRRILFSLIASVLGLLFVWALAEVAFRGIVFWRSQQYPTQTTAVDPLMGWHAVPNFEFKGTVPDAAGNNYELNFSTDENGFKYFDAGQDTNHKRLLVIGDSYTHAIEVSNDKSYYGLLKDSLQKNEVDLFAYGARGIGPLQQLIWMKEWLPKIEPDVILWQYCFNDIYNSSYELESNSYFNNNRRIRPFYEEGQIVYRNPARLGMANLREFSMFLDFIITKIEVIIEGNDHKNNRASEDYVQAQGKNYTPYAHALTTLDELIRQMQVQMDTGMTILAFPVDNTQPYFDDMTAVFEKNGIAVVKEIPLKIAAAANAGKTVYAKDKAHWNEEGHKLAAESLWPMLHALLH